MPVFSLPKPALAATVSLSLALVPSLDAGSVEVVFLGSTVGGATDGEPVPGGDGYFFAPNAPAINGAGSLGFQSDLTATSGTSNTGIFRYVGGALQTVARQGDPMPDFNGNLALLVVDPLINDVGEIVFGTTLANTLGGFTDAAVILRYPVGDGDPTTIVRGGQAPPVGDGLFSGTPGALSPRAFNAAGEVAFGAALSNTIQFSGLYRGDGTETVEIARQGNAAPIKGTTYSTLSVGLVDLNASGEVGFTANLFGGGPQVGVFVGDGDDTRTIAADEDITPGGDEIASFIAIDLNEAGQVSMLAAVSDGAVFKREIFRGDGGALTPIMERGDPLPNPPGLFLDASLVGPSVDMNASGAVAFQAQLTGTARGADDDTGIFVGDGVTVREVAREGDVPPGGGDRELDLLQPPLINDAGQVTFLAVLREPGGPFGSEIALFWWDPVIGLVEIIREGDPIGGGTLSGSLFLFADETELGQRRGFNDDGTVTFSFFAGAAGVATWSPPSPCIADLDGNGTVGFADLQVILQSWGTTGPGNIDGTGTIGFNDLGILLNAWGACP